MSTLQMQKVVKEPRNVENLLNWASRDWNNNGQRVFTGTAIALGCTLVFYLVLIGLWLFFRHLFIAT